MKLLSCEATNFASYKQLEFSFDSLGLSLVYGPTGAGKSTLQDLPCWILYGITSKQGPVDDIRSWYEPESTTGILSLEVKGVKLVITRIRGRQTENDLYWTEADEPKEYRGKDITETQKLLEQRLGISSDLYITAAYSSEFSPTSTFFIDKPKTKRDLFEKIADLSLPIKLEEKIKNERKELKKQVKEKEETKARQDGRLEELEAAIKRSEINALRWDSDREKRIRDLQSKYQNFEELKQKDLQQIKLNIANWESEKQYAIEVLQSKLDELNNYLSVHSNLAKCELCGSEHKGIQQAALKKVQLEHKLESQQKLTNQWVHEYKIKSESVNTYGNELISLQNSKNPYSQENHELNIKIQFQKEQLLILESEVNQKHEKLSKLETLESLSLQLRGLLLERAINNVEKLTNAYLEKHFDSELRVRFELSQADSFSVEVSKNGYNCSFRQLSTGQRRLLTLCFTVSVMQYAANESGVHFNLLSFDECLNGLDSDLKVKAFALFTELSQTHESILLIEHALEFQNLFENKYKVILVDDNSMIIRES